ncbi:MAG: hypothetical protein IJZ06_08000 [Bacteroidales bacterium]|nr:hypothetical protein [Bacteroidales bacterium]
MNTKSKKFKRNTVVSHHDNCGDPNCTLPDTTTGAENNSGKFDWNEFAGGAVKDVTNMLSEWLRKTPSTVNTTNVTPPKDNTGLYVGLGAGALVLVVLLVVLLKK